jgi:hypothetical protein
MRQRSLAHMACPHYTVIILLLGSPVHLGHVLYHTVQLLPDHEEETGFHPCRLIKGFDLCQDHKDAIV